MVEPQRPERELVGDGGPAEGRSRQQQGADDGAQRGSGEGGSAVSGHHVGIPLAARGGAPRRGAEVRSEERRGGKEWVRTCRFGGSAGHIKKTTHTQQPPHALKT